MDDNIEEKAKNKKKENIKINLDPNRNIYFLKNSDITIIEMKEEDGLDNYIFLELDDNLLKEDSEIFYKDDSIYIKSKKKLRFLMDYLLTEIEMKYLYIVILVNAL